MGERNLIDPEVSASSISHPLLPSESSTPPVQNPHGPYTKVPLPAGHLQTMLLTSISYPLPT